MRVLSAAVLFVTAAATSIAFATISNGPSTSGGGHSVVCRGGDGSIRSAELLDLYEARNKYHFTLRPSAGTIEADYIEAVRQNYELQSVNYKGTDTDILKGLTRFMGLVKFSEPGQRPPRLFDIGNTISLPPGCQLEQLAFFDDLKNEVEIDTEIWNHLDSLNQSALVTHEVYYHIERSFLERTSEGTRAFVAHIYAADNEVTPIFSGVPKDARFCYTKSAKTLTTRIGDSYFYVYSSPDKASTVFQFGEIMGRPVVAKGTATFSGLKWRMGYRNVGGINKYVPVDQGARTWREPVVGSQRDDWEVEVTYNYLNPVEVSLYQKGIKIAQSNIEYCYK